MTHLITQQPIVDQIADVLIERIDIAEIVNTKVLRPDREARRIDTVDSTIVVQQTQLLVNDQATHDGNPIALGLDVIFNVRCHIKNRATCEHDFQAECNRVAAAVYQAIVKPSIDPAMWYQFDGLAINARIGSVMQMTNEQGIHAGVMLPVTITFRISEDDPYEARA